VRAALQEEQHIRQAIEQADLPLNEVSTEVDGLVRALETMAKRAQTLWDYLASQDPQAIEARCRQLEREGGPEGKPIVVALRQQLEALGALRKQLDKFFAQMEHIVASLGTMNAQVLRMSLVTETDSEEQLAGQARELREQVNALADGMSEVYQQADDAAAAAPSNPPGLTSRP
jgi:chromosome segregation ATPase